MRLSIFLFGWFFCTMLTSSPLSAAIVPHSTLTSFLAAAGSPIQVVDFETVPAPTFINNNSTFNGITFVYGPSFVTERLRVTDGIPTGAQLSTTSGTRFLGTDVVGDQLVPDGGRHDFTMQFSVPVQAVGLSVIVSANQLSAVLAGDFVLTAGSASVSSTVPEATVLADGSRFFFLGLTETLGAPLGSVSLRTVGATGFQYRVDDIRRVQAVPEPNTTLGAACLLALMGPFIRPSRRPTA